MLLRQKGLRSATTLSLLLLSGTALTISGCENPRKAEIRLELSELGSKCDSARQSVSNGESALKAMQQRRTDRHAQLNEYNASVQGYMLDHKMAVAALAAGVGGAQISSDNTYSADAKQVGSAVALLAGLWAIGNMDEVSDVLKTLNEADAHVGTLKSDLAQTTEAIQQEERSIEASKEQLELLVQQQRGLQAELRAL